MTRVGSTEITVIRPIDTTNKGPKVPLGKGKKGWQPVHLRQGSMDGACGLYSLMMGLIISGAVSYDDARSLRTFSSKSRIRKLIDNFCIFDPLLIEGVGLDQMYDVISVEIGRLYKGKIGCQGWINKGNDIAGFIEAEISHDHPVLLPIKFEGGGHWVLAIGCEYERQGRDTSLCRFLILDPDEYTPLTCSWNGIIDARKQGGKYPYHWWTGDRKIQIPYALSIWPNKL